MPHSSVYTSANPALSNNPWANTAAPNTPPPPFTEMAAPMPLHQAPPAPAPRFASAGAPVHQQAPSAYGQPQQRPTRVRQGFWRDHTTFGALLSPRFSTVQGPHQTQTTTGPKPDSLDAKTTKFLYKWTSKVGLAKIGALVGLTGLAGVGAYFGITAIMAAVAAGAGAKIAAVMIPVSIGIAAALVVVVLARVGYKAWKNMRKDLEVKVQNQQVQNQR